MKITKGSTLKELRFITGKKIFKKDKLRYINLFELTSVYNTYKRGLLCETNTRNITIGKGIWIFSNKSIELLAYYTKLENKEKEFLDFEKMKITTISYDEYEKLLFEKNNNIKFLEKVRVNGKINKTVRNWNYAYMVLRNNDEILTTAKNKKELSELFKREEITERERKIIEEIVKDEGKEQLILNMMYFSNFFEIMSVEDLKNEMYLVFIYILKKQNVEKPQKKVRGHRNLELMFDFMKFVNSNDHRGYCMFEKMDLIKVLENLNEDNVYFLKNYFMGSMNNVNIKTYENKYDLFNTGLEKFMKLESYKYKEQLALNFQKTTIIKNFVEGMKRNDILRKIKLMNITSEKRKATREANEKMKRVTGGEIKGINELKNIKEKTKEEALKTIKNTQYIRNYDGRENRYINNLKKDKTKSIIEKALENSWIKVAKSKEEVSKAGSKASCCLNENGALKGLVDIIHNNNQLVCLYGEINSKNFQILAYLKAETEPYRRTIVLDNIEANKELEEEEYYKIIKEIKAVRGYGLHVGAIRTDVKHIKEELSKVKRAQPNKIKERRNMGILDETYYFHDYKNYIEEKKASRAKIPKNLIVRPATDSDLIQLSQIEKETYGNYDEENIYIKEYLKGNEKINVISDNDRNIYGYSIVRKIETVLDLAEHIENTNLVNKIEILSKNLEEVKEWINKEKCEYTYIEDFNVIKELRKSRIIYDLAKLTIDSIKEYGKKEVHYHSNENSKNMEHFLLRKGLTPIDINNKKELKKDNKIKKAV